MLFISFLKAKHAGSLEALSRRAQWRPPKDMRVIAEYWLSSRDPTVVVVCEADSQSIVDVANAEWSDLFEIAVVRGVAAKRGLEIMERALEPVQTVK